MTVESMERRLLLAKLETTYGTDPTPTAVANAIVIHNSESQIEADELALERDSPFFGNDPSVLTGKRSTLRGEIELVGAVTPGNAAPIGPLLRMTGHAQVLTPGSLAEYSPISTGFESGTLYFYHAGVLYEANGTRGALEQLTLNIKDFPKARLNFMGLYVTPVEAALPSGADWSAFQEPPVSEAETLTVTVNGVAVECTQFQLTTNTTVRITEHSEGREVFILDRKPTITLRMHRAAFASLNPYALANARTRVPIIAETDGGAGKIIRVEAPLCQFAFPRVVEEDSFRMLEIQARCLGSAAGDDDYSIAFE